MPNWWIAVAGAAALVAVAGCQVPDPPNAVWVEVPPDAPVEMVGRILETHRIVPSATEFERFARWGRRHEGIKPGLYPLQPGTPIGKVMVILRKGRPPTGKVVVRERMTVAEISREIEAALGIPADRTVRVAADSTLRARTGARAETIEGYLYPTTYYVLREATAIEVLTQMVDTFEARWNPAWNARLAAVGMSRDEIVTLASIIEGEMPHEDERLSVASVYHNRLARNIRLQADPTVVYALGERRRLTFNDYRVPSDYNTYNIRGLPPGPIGQPTTQSIEAALYPAATDFLYFVGRGDGRHEFSRTYREHLLTIRRVRGR